jgi:aerobic carbon-monoxide dehydrogenase medium subunit
MPTAPYTYQKAASFEEAVRLVADGDGRVIAGGQSLVPLMCLGLADPALLVDISACGARRITRDTDRLVIPSVTRHTDIERSADAAAALPILPEAARLIGNIRVRNRGTIGGSLAHSDASAEWPCVTVALDALVHTVGPSGSRVIAARDLFVTHFTTILEPAEIITRIDVPISGAGHGAAFDEYTRRAGDFALVAAAACVTLDDHRRITSLRVVLGAVADRPVDASDHLTGLVGAPLDAAAADAAGGIVADSVEPSEHSQVSVAWRRDLVRAVTTSAIIRAGLRAIGGSL